MTRSLFLIGTAVFWFLAQTTADAQIYPPVPPVPQPPNEKELPELRKYFVEPSPADRLRNGKVPVKSIFPHFTFRRPARYGLDLNHDGIVDLPNSWEYVHNLPSWDSRGCPCVNDNCSTGQARFRVVFTPKQEVFPPLSTLRPQPGRSGAEPPAPITQIRRSMRRLNWTIEGPNIQTINSSLAYTWPPYEVCLPEGEYSVTLKATDNYTGEWAEHRKTITVEDILIVQLGDSYASGEGAPERQVRAALHLGQYSIWREDVEEALRKVDKQTAYIRWQDDGKPYGISAETRTITIPLPGRFISFSYVVALPEYSAFSAMHQQHYRAHRSSFNASSQLALEVEAGSDKFSVTYVNLAMSGGSTNEGMLGSYEGHKGQFHSRTNPMASQLMQLQQIVGKRQIDALIISIGGNDAGFSNAIEGLIARDGFDRYQVNFGMIESAIKTGQWSQVENKASFFQWRLSWSNLLGLDAVPSQYQLIKQDLALRGVQAKQVYVTQYPDPGKHHTVLGDVYCSQVMNTFSTNSAPGGREVNSDELEWARKHLVNPLNEAVKRGADQNGWTYVDGLVASMERHGLCASPVPYSYLRYNPQHPIVDRPDELNMRWFRQEDEAATIENKDVMDATLTLHPNEYGYKAIKRRLKEIITLPTVRDETKH